MSDPKKVIAELEATHTRIAHAKLRDGTLIAFRAPSLEEWEDFQEALKDKRRGVAFRELAQRTRLLPSSDEELQVIFDRAPAIAACISDALGELAESGIEFTVKKG